MNLSRASRPVVRIGSTSQEALEMWQRVRAVAETVPCERWVLIGGLMVQLHALRASPDSPIRSTFDIDVLADGRARPSGTEVVAEMLVDQGFSPEIPYGVGRPLTVHRFRLGEIAVDVLGPDGLRAGHASRTVPPNVTISVPGGSQALRRAETVEVRIPGCRPVLVRTPSLLGAVLLKARSVVGASRDKDRGDLALLLSCIDDPMALREELVGRERRWLVDAHRSFRPDDRGLDDIIGFERTRLARQSYRLLCAE